MSSVARVKIFHSPTNTPTRRVAPGEVHGTPDAIELLARCLVADYCLHADQHDVADLRELLLRPHDLHLPMTRLRFRLQNDTVGLDWSWHHLRFQGGHTHVEIDTHGPPAAQVLGMVWAVFHNLGTRAAGDLSTYTTKAAPVRVVHIQSQRRTPPVSAMSADGLGTDGLVTAWPEQVTWALEHLGLHEPTDLAAVRRAFRTQVRAAHPDRGADASRAAERLHDLDVARQILTSWIDMTTTGAHPASGGPTAM